MRGLMKAAAIERFSPPSVLELHKLPIPQPGWDEILIALTAAGVGVWDAEVRDGAWQPPASLSFLSSWARTGREWSRPRERGCVVSPWAIESGLQVYKSQWRILRRIRGCKGARCRAGSEAS